MEAVSGFDWDSGNIAKCQKHGLSIAVIEQLFGSRIAVLPDPVHSVAEQRFKAIGQAEDGRGVLMVFTLRIKNGGTWIRPISARFMQRKEVAYYEKTIAGSEQ